MNARKLQSLTKQDLIEKCKEQNINCYGTKFDMVQRLLASEKNGVVNDIKHSIPSIIIEKDPQTGKHIHVQSSLVFDAKEKRVVAKKSPDGALRPLQYEDIKQCLKYKFRYVLPENLALEDSCPSSSLAKEENLVSRDEVLEKRLKEIEEGIVDDANDKQDLIDGEDDEDLDGDGDDDL